MHKMAILFLAVGLTNCVLAQDYVNLTRTVAKNTFAKYAGAQQLQTTTEETDSTITFLVRDPRVEKLDIILHFDGRGKCDIEERHLSCNVCYDEFINNTLNNRKYKWKRINSNTFFARAFSQLIMTVRLHGPLSYLVRRSKLRAAEYRQIIRSARN